MKLIKYSLLAVFATILLTACGAEGGENNPSKDPAKLRQAIKEKKEKIRSLEEELAQMEKQLIALDPSLAEGKEINITTGKVIKKDFLHFVELQGNITTAQDPAMASSETGGRITELLVKEDSYIKKGDLVAKVDLESIRKSIAEIETSLGLATDMYNRQKTLWDKNIGSEVQYLQAKNQVEQLTKTKERLEFELTKANVYAPANGYVEMVMVKEGEICGPGTPIIQIVNTSALKMVAQVPEKYLKTIKKGDRVTVNFPAIGESQSARVNEIGRVINSANRTFEVEASINNMNGLVKPNLLATMQVKDEEIKDAVVINNNLVMQDVDGNNYVMILKNGTASKKVVKLGNSYKNEVVISSGLSGDETIIVKGARQVIEGDKVKVIGEESTGIAENN
jgi:membrane fusion protein (multidrug efflux system)